MSPNRQSLLIVVGLLALAGIYFLAQQYNQSEKEKYWQRISPYNSAWYKEQKARQKQRHDSILRLWARDVTAHDKAQ